MFYEVFIFQILQQNLFGSWPIVFFPYVSVQLIQNIWYRWKYIKHEQVTDTPGETPSNLIAVRYYLRYSVESRNCVEHKDACPPEPCVHAGSCADTSS